MAREILAANPDFDARMARRSGEIGLEHVPDPSLVVNLRAAGLLGGPADAG